MSTQVVGIAWKAPLAFTDIRYENAEGIAQIEIHRPAVRNEFRPSTTGNLIHACVTGRELRYVCRQYDAQEGLDMGLVNAVVPVERLEEETGGWCREMLAMSPLALRCLKASFNAEMDGQAGLQELAGNATLLYYMTE